MVSMVDLDTDAVDGADIHIAIELVIFVAMLTGFYAVIEFYVRKPFLATYCLIFLLVCIALRISSHGFQIFGLSKQFLVFTVWMVGSLWRISCFVLCVLGSIYCASQCTRCHCSDFLNQCFQRMIM